MQCPDCDLPVHIKDGTITPHLRPDTLTPCAGKASKGTPATPSKADGDDKPPSSQRDKPTTKKTPAKSAKPHKT